MEKVGEVRGRGCAGVASLCLPLGAGPYYLQLQPSEGTPINAPPLLSHPAPLSSSLVIWAPPSPPTKSSPPSFSVFLQTYLPPSDIFSHDMLCFSCLEGSGRSKHFSGTSFWEGDFKSISTLHVVPSIGPSSSCSSSCYWPGV